MDQSLDTEGQEHGEVCGQSTCPEYVLGHGESDHSGYFYGEAEHNVITASVSLPAALLISTILCYP